MRKMKVLLVNVLCLTLCAGNAYSEEVRLYPLAEVVRDLASAFEPGTTEYVVIMQHALMARGRIKDERQFREELGRSEALANVQLETVAQSSGDGNASEVLNMTAEMRSRDPVKARATRSGLRDEAELSALVRNVLEGAECTSISVHSKSGLESDGFGVQYRWRCPSTVLELASLLGKLESDAAGVALDDLRIYPRRTGVEGRDTVDVAFDALVTIGDEI